MRCGIAPSACTTFQVSPIRLADLQEVPCSICAWIFCKSFARVGGFTCGLFIIGFPLGLGFSWAPMSASMLPMARATFFHAAACLTPIGHPRISFIVVHRSSPSSSSLLTAMHPSGASFLFDIILPMLFGGSFLFFAGSRLTKRGFRPQWCFSCLPFLECLADYLCTWCP